MTSEVASKPANPNPKKRLAFAGVLLAVCLAFGLGWAGSQAIGTADRCLTVAETWQNVRYLDGSQVCVRGKAYFMGKMTLMLCVPDRCGCNETLGWVELVNEGAIWGIGTQHITSSEPFCEGDQCTMVCEPFCPIHGMVYELTGTLVLDQQSKPPSLALTEIDLATARQFQDGKWVPVPLGTFELSTGKDACQP